MACQSTEVGTAAQATYKKLCLAQEVSSSMNFCDARWEDIPSFYSSWDMPGENICSTI